MEKFDILTFVRNFYLVFKNVFDLISIFYLNYYIISSDLKNTIRTFGKKKKESYSSGRYS